MKNLIAGFIIIATSLVSNVMGSDTLELGTPLVPISKKLDAIDLQTLTSSPVEMITAIRDAEEKDGSYLYRLWAKIATMNPEQYKELYDWRVKTFFELIKKHFSDNSELAALILSDGEVKTDSSLQIPEIKKASKKDRSQDRKQVYPLSEFISKPSPTKNKPSNSSVEINTKEKKYDQCWEILAALFNDADKATNRKIRLFIAENRALLFNKIAHLNEHDHELAWLSYMTRLETIWLKDEHVIATGELAHKFAQAVAQDAINQTYDVLLSMVEHSYFKEHWLGKISSRSIWGGLLRQELRMGSVEPSKRDSAPPPSYHLTSSATGGNRIRAGFNPQAVAPDNGYVSVFGCNLLTWRNALCPSAQPFQIQGNKGRPPAYYGYRDVATAPYYR